eukprot:TRINITY_DN1445_c0_g2_i4.p1 TRINITY_DN1445_c0_g2~~TRINITY_DN1445_c0_g2_i4.p1  ORF type:complete len:891 (+),score=195.21 TRINITY_DN1445_c0_g2_i4:43-2673(+)
MIRTMITILMVIAGITCTPAKKIRTHEYGEMLRQGVQNAKDLLHNVKDPQEVEHSFNNKYDLAEWYSNVGLGAIANTLRTIGIQNTQLLEAKNLHDSGHKVTLEYEHNLGVQFDKKVERETVHGQKQWDYFWTLTADIEMKITTPADAPNSIPILKYTSKMQVITRMDAEPVRGAVVRQSIPLSWFLEQMASRENGINFQFRIDRSDKHCHTPLTNRDVGNFLSDLERFNSQVNTIRGDISNLMRVEAKFSDRYNFDFQSVVSYCDDAVPVVPLVKVVDQSKNESFSCLEQNDVATLYNAERSCLSSSIDKIIEHSTPVKFCAGDCVKVGVVFEHLKAISQATRAAHVYIEEGIRRQLRSAIAEDITPQQFQEYMAYHQEDLFKKEYQMHPFNSIIRRPFHYPEGTLSLPTHVSTKSMPNSTSLLSFRGVDLELQGSLNLHSWVTYSFDQVAPPVTLSARSRQFSGFILLVGTLATGNTFVPESAMIIQNKDELEVTLRASQLPSPGEFKDFISSLSPEMQRFAKSFRTKQLAGTLTAFAIVQIKPHLERVLNLPTGSLTKEIKLTQDVLKLLVEYQIPSDLLSFDSAIEPATSEKGTLTMIQQVKHHVDSLMSMIDKKLDKKVADKKREREYDEVMEEEPEQVKNIKRKRVSKSAIRPPPSYESVVMETAALHASADYDDAEGKHPSRSSSDLTADAHSQKQEKEPSTVADSQKASKPSTVSTPAVDDFTAVPFRLESNMIRLDPSQSMKPSKIQLSNWKKHSRDLFGSDSTTLLQKSDLKKETDGAFDLLDSLTKTADLPLEDTEVHVFLTVTHAFDEIVLENVIKNNENIIESAEASLLVLASTVHGLEPSHLIKKEAIPRLQNYTSYLFPSP